MKLTIIGVGLIGGSIALKLRENHFVDYVYGVDQSEQHLAEAAASSISVPRSKLRATLPK